MTKVTQLSLEFYFFDKYGWNNESFKVVCFLNLINIYLSIYLSVCVCSWAAVLHSSMLDLIIRTHFVYMILL